MPSSTSDPAAPPPDGQPDGWTGWALAGLGALAAAALVLEFGFEWGAPLEGWLHAVQAAVATVYVLDLLAALRRPEPRWLARGEEPAAGPYRSRPTLVLRRRWLEFLMAGAMPLGIIAVWWFEQAPDSMAPVQLFLLMTLGLRLLRVQDRVLSLPVATEWLLMGSYGVLILIGALLLMMPRAIEPGVAPLQPMEALFTSTSASTVTGLTLRETGETFSGLGVGILAVLIQLGGLGVITFVALVSVTSGKLFSVPQMVSLQGLFSARGMSDVRRQITAVVFLTIVCEANGAALLLLWAPPEVGDGQEALVWAVFHSISGFCNAGFTLGELRFGAEDWAAVAWTLMALVLVGGVGYPVLRDCVLVRGKWKRRSCTASAASSASGCTAGSLCS